MSYCPYCSKKLADGEVCSCRTPKESQAAPLTPEADLPAPEATAAPEVTAEPETVAEPEVTAEPADPHADVNLGAGMKKALSPFTEKCKAFFRDPKKRPWTVIGAAAALVLLTVLIVVLSVAGNNYMKPINTLVSELNKGTDADYLTVTCAFGTEQFLDLQKKNAKLLGKELLESNQESLEKKMEDLTDELPDFKLKFETKKAEKIEKSELKDCQEDIRNMISDKSIENLEEISIEIFQLLYTYEDESKSDLEKFRKNTVSYEKDLQSAKVSKGYEVRGRFVLNDGKDTVARTDYVTLIILKIDGDWAVFKTKDYESFSWEYRSEDYDQYSYSFLTTYFNETFDDMSPF